jgi:hypothetical protein
MAIPQIGRRADLAVIGNFSTGTNAGKASCSDGLSFWFTIPAAGQLARF